MSNEIGPMHKTHIDDEEWDDRMMEYLTRLTDIIDRHGHACQGVLATEEGHSSFIYTVGLSKRGWPELIMLFPASDIDGAHWILNRVVELLGDEKPHDGQLLPDLADTGYRLRLRACKALGHDYPLTFAGWYGGRDISALQVLCPDDEHRYPGEPGATDKTWQALLPEPSST